MFTGGEQYVVKLCTAGGMAAWRLGGSSRRMQGRCCTKHSCVCLDKQQGVVGCFKVYCTLQKGLWDSARRRYVSRLTYQHLPWPVEPLGVFLL